MSANNGIIRIGRKGMKTFAFGEHGTPFEVDVVVVLQQWYVIDDNFRPMEEDAEGGRSIPTAELPAYHKAAQAYVSEISNTPNLSVSEALDFIARLREQYDELAVFFRPKLREEPASPATLEVETRFSEEAT